MKVSEVSQIDGRMCAQLINLLKHGKWELSGPDISAHADTVKWVHGLAGAMAQQLNPQGNPPTGGFRVKAAGPLPPAPNAGPKSSGKPSKSKKGKGK